MLATMDMVSYSCSISGRMNFNVKDFPAPLQRIENSQIIDPPLLRARELGLQQRQLAFAADAPQK